MKRIRIVAAGASQQMVRGLRVVPGGEKAHCEDSTMIGLVAVLVGAAFPRHDRFERRRLEARHPPLKRRVVRDAKRADVAAAPWLARDPLEAIVGVERFLERTRLRFAR